MALSWRAVAKKLCLKYSSSRWRSPHYSNRVGTATSTNHKHLHITTYKLASSIRTFFYISAIFALFAGTLITIFGNYLPEPFRRGEYSSTPIKMSGNYRSIAYFANCMLFNYNRCIDDTLISIRGYIWQESQPPGPSSRQAHPRVVRLRQCSAGERGSVSIRFSSAFKPFKAYAQCSRLQYCFFSLCSICLLLFLGCLWVNAQTAPHLYPALSLTEIRNCYL